MRPSVDAGGGGESQLVLLRCLQESLANAVRHQPGSSTTVTVEARDDIHVRVLSEGGKRREFHFVYGPKDGPFRLNLAFHKTRVGKSEIIDALRGVLRQLESGEIDLPRK